MKKTLGRSPAIGEQLVSKSYPPITRHLLALYCGASGDENPVHVDSDFACEAGFPDVFAHGMLVMGLLGQALTDVVPPAAVRSFSTRFAAMTRVGTQLTCTGTVSALFEDEGEALARVALTAIDANGETKLAGDAVIAL